MEIAIVVVKRTKWLLYCTILLYVVDQTVHCDVFLLHPVLCNCIV